MWMDIISDYVGIYPISGVRAHQHFSVIYRFIVCPTIFHLHTTKVCTNFPNLYSSAASSTKVFISHVEQSYISLVGWPSQTIGEVLSSISRTINNFWLLHNWHQNKGCCRPKHGKDAASCVVALVWIAYWRSWVWLCRPHFFWNL